MNAVAARATRDRVGYSIFSILFGKKTAKKPKKKKSAVNIVRASVSRRGYAAIGGAEINIESNQFCSSVYFLYRQIRDFSSFATWSYECQNAMLNVP